jgi:hypothetical protein
MAPPNPSVAHRADTIDYAEFDREKPAIRWAAPAVFRLHRCFHPPPEGGYTAADFQFAPYSCELSF